MNVLITGASSGIGQALTLLLAERQSTILLTARRAERLAELANTVVERGGKAHVIPADLENSSDVLMLAKTAQQLVSELDVVVHNAGRGIVASVEDTSLQMWQQMIMLNVTAPFLLTRELLPRMRAHGSGHHIFVSSMAGKIGYPYNSAYVAAKHALAGFVAALRGELINTSIQATLVCPSGVATEWGNVTEGRNINDFYAKALPRSREIVRNTGLPLAPLKKLISATEVARQIVQAIDNGRNNDIYTHDGTEVLAIQAQSERIAQEEEHRALWLAMEEIYHTNT